jgi:carboxypeptidase Q
MRTLFRTIFFASAFLAATIPALAQIPKVQSDPLHPTQMIQGAGACSATEVSSCAQAAAKITPIVMGESPLEENLRRLTDEIGGRISGSPEMARAAEWGVAAFRAAGVDVHTETYSLPIAWSEGNSRLEISGPEKFPVSFVSAGLSPATPAGGIEGPLVDIQYGTEQDFANAGSSAKGAILIVHTNLGSTWNDLFDEYMLPPPIIDRALKAGAAAILWTGERERKLLYRHTNSPDGTIEKIPQAVVAREDALRIQRAIAAHPGKMRARLELPNKIHGPVEEKNVVAEIRGYEKPNDVVILGAHLDSWELGTGALDNGCNAALVIEAARAIKASGLLPRSTIRFVLFSGEEQGLLGSFAYVRAHRSELDHVRAMITFDSGVGRVSGYSVSGRHDLDAALHEILKPFAGWNASTLTYDGSWGTDNFDFVLEGVPTLVANQEVANYLVNYHAASDTFDKVDIRELKLNTVLAAVTVWGIADRPEPLGKRLSRAEIPVLLQQTGMDQQMKSIGLWEAWQSGKRGREQ